jgi:REP element-mobilizing transposase RayT
MIGDDTYVYRNRLPHLIREEKTYFVTFVTKHRATLPEQVRDVVLEACVPRSRYYFHCAVVMPDHVHLILTPDQETLLKSIMQRIKSASSHLINRILSRRGSIWQRESFDHIIRSDESLAEKIEYVMNNPVRKGLVSHYTEWPWHYPK